MPQTYDDFNVYGQVPFDSDTFTDDVTYLSKLGQNARIGALIQKLQNYLSNRQATLSNFIEPWSIYETLVPDDLSLANPHVDTEYYLGPDEEPERYAAAEEFTKAVHDHIYNANDGHSIIITDRDGYSYKLTAWNSNYSVVSEYMKNGVTDTSYVLGYVLTSGGTKLRAGQFIYDITGTHMIAVYDLINDLVINSEINDLYLSVLLAVSGGTDNLNVKVSNALSKYLNSGHQEVVNEASSLLTSFSISGITGVLNRLIGVFKALGSIGVKESTLLDFTDNSGLCPQVYIAGLIESSLNAVSAIAAAIIGIVSPILGVITYFASTMITNFFSKPNLDWNQQTLCRVNDEANAPYFPTAMFQATGWFNVPKDLGNDFEKQCGQGNIPFLTHIGPAHVLWSTTDLDQSETRTETHLDLVDRRQILRDWINEYGVLTTDNLFFPLENDARYPIDVLKSRMNDSSLINQDFISNDPSVGTVSESDDRIMREIFVSNFIINYILFAYTDADKPGGLTLVNRSSSVVYISTLNGYAESDIPVDQRAEFVAFCNILLGYYYLIYLNDTAAFDNLCSWRSLVLMCDNKSNITPTGTSSPLLVFARSTSNMIDICKAYNTGENSIAGASTFAIELPKYDRQTFWSNVAVFSTLSTVAIVVGATIAFTTRSKISRWMTKDTAKIEAAWQKLVNNPNNANLDAYRGLIFKHNIFATIFGFTKYNKTSYWSSGASAGAAFIGSRIGSLVRSKSNDLLFNNDNTALLTELINRNNNNIGTAINKVETCDSNVIRVGKLIDGQFS